MAVTVLVPGIPGRDRSARFTTHRTVAVACAGAPTGASKPVAFRVTVDLTHRTFWLARLAVAAVVASPLAAPGVFTTAIIAFFIAWNDFVYGISLTSTERARPVTAALAFFTGESQFQDPSGPIAAAAVIVTIPVIILVLLFQRRIVAGLTNGAVKG